MRMIIETETGKKVTSRSKYLPLGRTEEIKSGADFFWLTIMVI